MEKACEEGNVTYVEDQVRSGRDVSESSGHLRALATMTPLDSSVVSNIVKVMIDHGAKVDYSDKRTGRTCLQMAAESNHLDLVHYLLDKGGKVNLADRRGSTPLHKAIKKPGKEGIVNMLIDRGARCSKDKAGKTPAYLMCKSGDYSCAKRILSESEDFGRDTHGRTGLYFAALSQFRGVNGFRKVPTTIGEKYDIFISGKSPVQPQL